MTQEAGRPTALRPRRAGAGPDVGTRAGRRANAVSCVLAVASGLCQGWALICLGRAVGDLLPGSGTGGSGDLGAWRGRLVVAALAVVLTGVFRAGAEAVSRASAAEQEGAIRAGLLNRLFALGPGAAAGRRSGSLVSLLTDGAERVALYRQTFLAPATAAVLSPLLVLVMLGGAVDWASAVVLAAAVVIVPGAVAGLHARLRRSSARSRAQRSRLAAEYLDAIQGLTTLILCRAADRRAAGLRREGERNRRAVMGLLAANQLVILLTDALCSLLLVAAAAGTALVRLRSGAVGAGDALAVALVGYVLLEPLDHVGAFFYVGMGGIANQRAMRRLLAAGDGERGTGDPDDAGARRGRAPAAPDLDRDSSMIIMSGVTAAWGRSPAPGGPGRPTHGGATRPGSGSAPGSAPADGGAGEATDAILSDVDLAIAAGERVAVVGPSGAGKSTLLALAAGDLLPTAGEVSVAGTALTPATRETVRAASAVVAQTTWLLTGTIADNLRLAAPDADEARLWWALEEAGVADEVRGMPDGLETAVGEGGTGLSGGQAQRVSLARAFLADRPLLILDEPTSQVDLASQARIVEAVGRLAQGRTVLAVSHRRGVLVGVDRTVRVAGGAVGPADPVGAPTPEGGEPGSGRGATASGVNHEGAPSGGPGAGRGTTR